MDTASERAHYSAMAAAQAAFDNRLPPDEDLDDDALTLEECQDIARDELQATPAWVADWLDKACDTPQGWSVLRVDHDAHFPGLSVAQLVAVLFNGTVTQTIQARDELRQRLLAAEKAWIDERAAELFAEQGVPV